MKQRYVKVKGYRRYTGMHDRPVYLMPMSAAEVKERRVLYGLIGGLGALLGGVVLWMACLI